ncbi:hypothetical protein V6615_15550 [Oscillospiraceae bacterium PP1C4]
MDYIAQAFTGGFGALSTSPQQLVRRISELADSLQVQAVIMGWSTDRTLYQAALEELHRRGMQGYLWMPVFSEMSSVVQGIPAVDYDGNRHRSAHVSEEEDFTFVCPSNPQNIEHVKEIYSSYFAGLGFDGVFLDKIRYSSFGNGFKPAIGCFCEQCRARYEHEGVDLTELRRYMAQEDKQFLLPFAFENGRYLFADNFINKLFKVRSDIITKSVAELSGWFKEQGLQVGLDVYAPVFAYYVGQDILSLSQHADFIKPMIYRVTDAPAGIPYEQQSMQRELRANGCEPGDVLGRLWKTDDLCSEQSLTAQLEALKGAHCKIYSGFEINAKPGICRTDVEYIRRTVQTLQNAGAARAVLSWDILSDTCGHIELLSKLEQGEGV